MLLYPRSCNPPGQVSNIFYENWVALGFPITRTVSVQFPLQLPTPRWDGVGVAAFVWAGARARKDLPGKISQARCPRQGVPGNCPRLDMSTFRSYHQSGQKKTWELSNTPKEEEFDARIFALSVFRNKTESGRRTGERFFWTPHTKHKSVP